jgi:hypothetical protein
MENRNIGHEDRNASTLQQRFAAARHTSADELGEAPLSFEELHLLIEFFRLLDRWDRQEGAMKPSRCRCWGARAEYSVCVLVSSLGLRPRQQKCGCAQAFCAACIQRLLSEQWANDAPGIQESLRQAYTAIAHRSGAESNSHRASECAIDRGQEEVGTNEPEVSACGRQ